MERRRYYEQRRNQFQESGQVHPDGHRDLLPAEDARDVTGTTCGKGKHRSHLSAIEAPNMVRAFSMEAFFNIADALDVTPEELIQIAFLQDKILKRKNQEK